jgi:hypothetical protein
MKYQGGKKSMKFLNEMKEIIPFETIEEILIEKNVYKPNIGKNRKTIYTIKDTIRSTFFRSNERFGRLKNHFFL